MSGVLQRGGVAIALIVAAAAAWPAPSPQDGDTEQGLRKILRAEGLRYENGEGVERDPKRAAAAYCSAAKLGDAVSQFNLGWMYANGRGVERSDATAAFFFHAAAEQGLEQAKNMLATVGGAPNYLPDCMVEREAKAPAPAPRAPSRPGPVPEIVTRAPPHILNLVKLVAPEYRVDPRLALAVIETESNYDAVALSPKNAKGLMQLIPETAARFGVRNPYDPAQNIRGGLQYLRWLLAYFEGDVMLAAAAYNAGEGAVDRYRGIPPYAETRAYVAKVITLAGMLSHPFDPAVTEPSPRLPSMRTGLQFRR
jgi:soluble lytic murein transglycosylase-like protein